VYLAFDNDARGREATGLVARLFNPDKVYDLKFSNRKDANEYLQKGEATELYNIYINAKRYLPDSLVSSRSEFKKILLTETEKGIPYPFRCLNNMTYGIRRGETVLFLAQEKVGKTELMHFIEHKLLTESKENVGAIYLEEPNKRHLQALAGIELKRPVHLPDSGCSDDQVVNAIDNIVEKDDRLFIYSSFGNTDPDILLTTIRYLATSCGCNYIIFDHITMGVVGSSKMDHIRGNLDYLITKLEMLVKELNIAIIIVSHVNDEGKPRESHYLTKVADITIRAERDLMSDDPLIKNTWHLSVVYNRFCGKTGYAGKALFDLNTYSFFEESNELERTEILG
jgi:twinkle protein